ncbi:carboxypeptidase M32 [Clostridium algidicarnis]|uniref:Metal-dependent carboxypeptidase n=1 Tax=Clostridium algidicarnis DSM 15099 TaxID=1121295 RepID=A0A2S6FUK8_9CLOT|nr:carboxypeptidase M32 [Clostridium algidicarnis]PPK43904.1 carboxypeptidase Taq [Clostridium algidicarnis DSM 15099]
MNKEHGEKLNEVREYMLDLEHLNQAIGLVYWDMRVGIPKKAIDSRSEVIGYLSGESYKLSTSDKVKEFIDYFEGVEGLDDISSSMIENLKKEYEKTKKIPSDRHKEYTILASKSEVAWEEAKDKSDFEIFKPYLQKVVDFKDEFINYWGYDKNKYDTLLDFYEPSITVEKLDNIFGELRDGIVELLEKINNSKVKPRDDFFKKEFSKESQEEFSKFVVEKLGYDFDAGRIDESVHPFTINFGNKDVRITTKYLTNEFRSALFSTIHEGGHAIYEQDIPDELNGTGLGTGASMGIHESQSRFYENIIGRSKSFWKYFYPEAKKRFPQFEGISLEEFYKGLNTVEPSLIRTEADELTYSLHVIIRYEIEKALVNGKIKVEDLPRVWNEKYKEYLGIEASCDAEGVLQDMHWSDGSFGYFPSYALGNIYGAQFLNKMKKDIPNMDEEIEKGNFEDIHKWLSENIHKHGAVYKPADLIKMVTGEELTAKYFIEYLNKKYTEIYDL